ncbi:1-deoxy-D-xylulose-5-phosphate synthase [bioreactor metagenome]|uniref:1-deoxy-D-xylulose-5-phosphate synthase n=1 Tax=bioreactor metagenome TaxID=1076179 RepID=A0A645CFE2_9ZZZZ
MAYALKLLKRPNRVFCIIGDGECNEGQVWEALQFIVHKKLSNLIILVDNNHQQVDGFTADVSFDFHFPALFKSLGFVTAEADGSDLRDIDKAINKMLKIENQAKMIILNTKKAQLLPYYENKAASHHLKLTDTDRGYFAKYINELIQQREMLKHDVQADQY